MKTGFTFFDFLTLAIILVPAVRCLFRGFTKEILSLGGLVGGLIFGRLLCGPVGAMFQTWVQNEYAQKAIGFVVVYLIINTSCIVAAYVLNRLMKKTPLTAADRLGGFALGALKGIFVVGLFVLLVNGISGSIDHSILKNSLFARPILVFMKFLTGLVFPAGHAAV